MLQFMKHPNVKSETGAEFAGRNADSISLDHA